MLWTLREHDSSAAVTNSVADPKGGPTRCSCLDHELEKSILFSQRLLDCARELRVPHGFLF